MQNKRNFYTRKGKNVDVPLDAIHLGPDEYIRVESSAPENGVAPLRLFNRGYNDQRYLQVAISARYTDQAQMFAQQVNQKADRIYYEAETETFWVYLGTTNGNISDYQKFGGGLSDVGIGLSLDNDGNPKLGDGDNVTFVENNQFRIDLFGSYEDEQNLSGTSFYNFSTPSTSSSGISTAWRKLIGLAENFYLSNIGTNSVDEQSWAFIEAYQRTNFNQSLSKILVNAVQGISIFTQGNSLADNQKLSLGSRIEFLDNLLQRGAGDAADYSATKQALDYATKMMLDAAVAALELAIDDVVAGEFYQGTWNADTNTPTLTSSTGTLGHYYQVSVAGTTTLDGISSWDIGDEVVFNGSVWIKRASFGVKTINSKSGNNITLNQDEIPDGSTFKQYSQTEKTKLAGIETGAQLTNATNIGTAINGATTKTTPVDADTIPLVDSADSNLLKKLSWANIKATLKAYFDNLYNNYVHPNHTGDVTSVADGATTIANNAVNNDKLADMGASTIKGNNAGSTGNPMDLSPSQVRTLLNVAYGANNYTHPNHTGEVTSTSDGATVIATNIVANNKIRQSVGLSVMGRSANTTGNIADIAAASDHQVLRRSGTSIGFGAIALNQGNAVTGSLGVSNGGSGRATGGTAYGIIAAGTTATGIQQTISPGTAGQVLESNGPGALPSFKDKTGVISWVGVPASKTATGAIGQFAQDANFIYMCVATNTWDRMAKDTSNWSTV